MRRKLAAGNWKMNGCAAALSEISALIDAHPTAACDILVCPPATLLHRAATLASGCALLLGGQDCHPDGSGAHTGDISAQMLKDAGASAVIVGHSERRHDHAETDTLVQTKATAVLAEGLTVIVCIGETAGQRDAGETLDVIRTQLQGSVPPIDAGDTLVIAYEPVWAIGSGKTPTVAEIAEVHRVIRAWLKDTLGETTGDTIPLLYGGSVKLANAPEIFAIPDVDGALVGGASLKATDFSGIIAALEASSA